MKEKNDRSKSSRPRLPEHVKCRAWNPAGLREMKLRLRRGGLHTVCESARCPNIMECFSRPTAAFMILGDRCSRACGFCGVNKGLPRPPDPAEPETVAQAAAGLALRHVVVTSVTRDDLPDGGAEHFVRTIQALHAALPSASVEVLVPDFQGRPESISAVISAGPEVFNHNLETVPRLSQLVRSKADYARSLLLLAQAADMGKATGRKPLIKSGLMVGLGEAKEEVIRTLEDLAAAGCAVVTIGQYLQPRRACLPVVRYWEPQEFKELEEVGPRLGLRVYAGPLVRSSYLADQVYQTNEPPEGGKEILDGGPLRRR